MAPEPRPLPRFAAEPPQEGLPYGRWEERLRGEFLAGCLGLESGGEDLGDPGELLWYPDRTWHGRTYIPATSITSRGSELFGFVRFLPAADGDDPSDFWTQVDFTDQTAEDNPDWQIDICEEVVGSWRGPGSATAAMTLVWGRPLVAGGRIVTAELAGVTVDQCELVEERFTLLAPDDYKSDLLEIKLWNAKGQELACESLYEQDEATDAT